MANDPGRPNHTDEQYQTWLDEMKPFLKQAASLHYAMEKAGIIQHKDSIYKKYKEGDWFSEKVDIYRAYPGELVNNVFMREIDRIVEKSKKDERLSKDELDTIKFIAEKHRTAQTFFVNRTESAEAAPVGKILDDVERSTTQTDYSKLGSALAEQGVAANPPVQDQGQTGAISNVPA